MRKLLSLTLGLLTASSVLAEDKTITVPAMPNGDCTFVVKEIPESLGLEENELFPVHMGIVGKEFTKDTTVSFWISSEETLVCNVSTGKRPSVITRDTSICVNKDINPEVLGQFTPGTYWGQNKFTGNSYVEVKSTCINQITPDYIVYYDDSIPAPVDQDMIRPIRPDSFHIDPDANPVIPVYVPLRYLFTITDTITGCQAAKIANITVKDCSAPVMWQNYDGPKEIYVSYESEILSILNKDSIIATDPLMNCICPLPLDTIFESTQSDDIYSCGYFKYDVNVKLAAGGDTITVYIAHVTGPELSYHMDEYMIPDSKGNCTFTVPEFYIPEPDCICPRYYYLSGMTPNAGDTITESTDVIFTFRTACNDSFEVKSQVYIPKFHINATNNIDTVYAIDSLPIHSKKIVDITAKKWSFNIFTNTYEYGPGPYTLDVYRTSILSENKVWGDGIPEDQLYILDNADKSGVYYYVATDSLSGCQDTVWTCITVLSGDSTAAPIIPAEISEVKGDVYTITGVLVKKDVYLKEVMNNLKDGLYIFNKQKIFVRRR